MASYGETRADETDPGYLPGLNPTTTVWEFVGGAAAQQERWEQQPSTLSQMTAAELDALGELLDSLTPTV